MVWNGGVVETWGGGGYGWAVGGLHWVGGGSWEIGGVVGRVVALAVGGGAFAAGALAVEPVAAPFWAAGGAFAAGALAVEPAAAPVWADTADKLRRLSNSCVSSMKSENAE